jgi:hypothetical protein
MGCCLYINEDSNVTLTDKTWANYSSNFKSYCFIVSMDFIISVMDNFTMYSMNLFMNISHMHYPYYQVEVIHKKFINSLSLKYDYFLSFLIII